ncbi:hypothetical protein PFISCL1PPCAC_22988, partial [Pristionchus fissidentatus]
KLRHVFQVTPVRMPDYLQPMSVDPEVAAAPRKERTKSRIIVPEGPQRRNALFNVRETINEDEEEETPPLSPSSSSSLPSPPPEEQTAVTVSGTADYQKIVNAYKKHAKRLVKVVHRVTGGRKESEDDGSTYDLTTNEREEWEREQLKLPFHIP